jgi:hypothetical protein
MPVGGAARSCSSDMQIKADRAARTCLARQFEYKSSAAPLGHVPG